MFEIVDIDIKIDHKQFTDVVDEVISDESSNQGISFDWSDKEAHLTRSNTTMYKITFNNLDSNNNVEMVAQKSANDIIFKPIALRNFNETFYKYNYLDDDLIKVVLLALKRLAIKAKGNFGCIMDGNSTLVRDGRDISNHIVGLAIIDDKGKVYNLKNSGVQDIDDDEDSNTIGYVPKYLINDWLDENVQFQVKLQSVPKQDQFELMGQFAIYQKRKNMITADQFRDIMLQIGTFADMLGGFKDEALKNVYQFFV